MKIGNKISDILKDNHILFYNGSTSFRTKLSLSACIIDADVYWGIRNRLYVGIQNYITENLRDKIYAELNGPLYEQSTNTFVFKEHLK